MSNEQRFRNILITGCSSGIGLEFVRHFVANENSSKIVACYRSESRELKEIHERYKEKVISVEMDVCSEESIKNACQDVCNKLDCLDLLINNAGKHFLFIAKKKRWATKFRWKKQRRNFSWQRHSSEWTGLREDDRHFPHKLLRSIDGHQPLSPSPQEVRAQPCCRQYEQLLGFHGNHWEGKLCCLPCFQSRTEHADKM